MDGELGVLWRSVWDDLEWLNEAARGGGADAAAIEGRASQALDGMHRLHGRGAEALGREVPSGRMPGVSDSAARLVEAGVGYRDLLLRAWNGWREAGLHLGLTGDPKRDPVCLEDRDLEDGFLDVLADPVSFLLAAAQARANATPATEAVNAVSGLDLTHRVPISELLAPAVIEEVAWALCNIFDGAGGRKVPSSVFCEDAEALLLAAIRKAGYG